MLDKNVAMRKEFWLEEGYEFPDFATLVPLAQQDDQAVKQEIINNFEYLITKMVSANDLAGLAADSRQMAYEGLLKAIKCWEGRNYLRFPKFVAFKMRSELRNGQRRLFGHTDKVEELNECKRIYSADQQVFKEFAELDKHQTERLTVLFLLPQLTGNEQAVIRGIFEDKTLETIAGELGLDRRRAGELKRSAIQKLRKLPRQLPGREQILKGRPLC